MLRIQSIKDHGWKRGEGENSDHWKQDCIGS